MRLVAASVALIFALAPSGPAHAAADCTRFEIQIGACPTVSAHVGDHAVDLSAHASRPGRDTNTPAPGRPAIPGVPVEFVYENAASCSPDDPIAAFLVCRDDLTVTFAGTDIPWQPITIADLESFRPAPPGITAEPGGWAVVGLPANFVAGSQQEVVPGMLLGAPAEVRFTPVAYTWDYGDGTRRTTAEAGGTWDALGLAELAPTPTSHAYAARGRVSTSLTVTYAAEYRFLGPAWIPVTGTLDVSAPPLP